MTSGSALRSERTRVALVINDLRRAGAETQLVRLALGLDPTRFDAHIVLIKSQNAFAAELRGAQIPVAALGRSSAWDFAVVLRLRRHLIRTNPDVVHAYLPFAGLLSVFSTRLLPVKALILSQRSSYQLTLTPFWRRVARWAHAKARHVIVNSGAAYREEVAAGFPAERMTLIPNGIEVPELAPAPDRTALGLGAGPLVVCLAQLEVEKGHCDLLAAWASVRARRPDALLALVGEGRLRRALEAQAHALGLGSGVVFLGFRDPSAPLLAAADVAVLPSRSEGMPNAIQEAMALGKAIVATRAGGIPELIEDGASGRLVASADPAALAQALLEVLDDAALRAAFGEAARRRATQFSTGQMVAATERVYANALSAAREGAG